MIPETYKLYFFMLLMLCMGTVNMLMLKYQHMQLAPMRPGGEPQHFDHPWLQAAFMMVGELLCLPVYLCLRSAEDVISSERTPKWIFLIPCCCDLIATALLCMGLAFIAVSVAQMCRGTVIIFVCAMSYIFCVGDSVLTKLSELVWYCSELYLYQWLHCRHKRQGKVAPHHLCFWEFLSALLLRSFRQVCLSMRRRS